MVINGLICIESNIGLNTCARGGERRRYPHTFYTLKNREILGEGLESP